MTAHLAPLAALADALPPGAVLAHVVTNPGPRSARRRAHLEGRCWAKIGDEPWRSVDSAEVCALAVPVLEVRAGDEWYLTDIVTDSVVWEQDYGLRGRHEVMGVVG